MHDLSPGEGRERRGEEVGRGYKGEGREGRICWRLQMRWKAIR